MLKEGELASAIELLSTVLDKRCWRQKFPKKQQARKIPDLVAQGRAGGDRWTTKNSQGPCSKTFREWAERKMVGEEWFCYMYVKEQYRLFEISSSALCLVFRGSHYGLHLNWRLQVGQIYMHCYLYE